MEFNKESFRAASETNQEVKTPEELNVATTGSETAKPEDSAAVVAEVKTEVNTEVKPTETPLAVEKKEEVKPEEKKSLFDRFTEEKPKETASAPEVKSEIPEDVKAELEKGKIAQQELEKLKSIPIAKLLNGDYDLTNVDLNKFFKEAAGTDYSKLSTEQLMLEKIKSEYPSLPPEKHEALLKEDMEAFDLLSDAKKDATVSKMVDDFTKSQPQSEIFKTLTEIQANQKQVGDPEKYYEERVNKEFEEKYETVKTQVSEMAKALVGQSYNGFTVTPSVAEKMVEEYVSQTAQFDPEKLAFNMFKIASYEEYGRAEYERGKLEQVKENSNANKGTGENVMSTKEGQTGISGADRKTFRQAR